jgi:hypothetical protein
MKTHQQNAFTNPYGKDINGKNVYSSGNDPQNPNGFKRYLINDSEVWAYNYKDAKLKYKKGINSKQL